MTDHKLISESGDSAVMPETPIKSGYVPSKSPSSPDATCEAVVAASAEAVQRSDEAGYTVIDLDGNPWTICPWRYEAVR